MRIRDKYEPDDWTPNGPNILTPSTLDLIRVTIDTRGPVLITHWLYRGASAPNYCVFDDFEAFKTYLDTAARAGDIIDAWCVSDIAKRENFLIWGKCPDDEGRVPSKGAY
jgi:hypothetical protein